MVKTYKTKDTITVRCKKPDCGGIFKTTFNRIRNGKGCPLCSRRKKWKNIRSLASAKGFEIISSEEQYYQNPAVLAKCPQGHESKRDVDQLRMGYCPVCYRERLASTERIKVFAENLGFRLLEHLGGRTIKLECPKGHQFTTSWWIFRKKKRCTVEYKTPHYNLEFIKEELAKRGYRLADDQEYSHQRGFLKFVCPKGHEYQSCWAYFKQGCGCPKCVYQQSRGELELAAILGSWGQRIQERWKIGASGSDRREVDILLPDHKLGIEYCGLWYHSEEKRGRRSHLNKLDACLQKEIRLLTIFEDEWLNRREAVLNFIRAKIGMNKKVYARQCELVTPTNQEASEFLDRYHLQGAGNYQEVWGLAQGGELLMVGAFGIHHRPNVSREWMVLTRVCTRPGITVVGGLSRIISATTFPKILTYADRRFSEGDGYRKVGFKLAKVNPPDYYYCKGSIRFSKQSLKKKQEERKMDATEREIRFLQGYYRIWDCGKIRFELTR